MNKFLNTIILAVVIFLTGNWLWATPYPMGLQANRGNTWTADQTYDDNVKLVLGTGGDAALYYDGTHLVLEPMVVGVGNLVVNDETQLWIGPAAASSNQDHGVATTALIINQETADDNAIALKSSDLVTGLTTLPSPDAETDDYALISKISATEGGLRIQALAEDGGSSALALHFNVLGGTPTDTETTSSTGLVSFLIAEHDGSNARTNIPADGNIFSIQARSGDASTTRLLLKGDDGVLYLGNATPVGFDEHDDTALITDFENFRTKGQLISDYATMRDLGEYDRLVSVGLIGAVTEQEWNVGVRPLMSMQRNMDLLRGDSRQQHGRMEALLDILESDPSFRVKFNAALNAHGLEQLGRP